MVDGSLLLNTCPMLRWTPLRVVQLAAAVTGIICLFWVKYNWGKSSGDHVVLGLDHVIPQSDHVIPQPDEHDVTQTSDFVLEESDTIKQSSDTAIQGGGHYVMGIPAAGDVIKPAGDVIKPAGDVIKPARDVIKPYFYLVVLVLSLTAGERHQARSHWNNLTYWRHHRNLSLNIIYLAGAGDHGNETFLYDDVIYTDVTETKRNLRIKVQRGIQAALGRWEFKYLMKTDVDVFNNYEKYIEALRSQAHDVGYGGLFCYPHGAPYLVYCSGLGYVVHHKLALVAATFPLTKMADAEDRTMGVIAKESGVKLTRLQPNSTKLRLKFTECDQIRELWNEQNKIAIHTGYYVGSARLYECWEMSFPSGYIED